MITSFQKNVYNAVRRIPRGCVATYAEIARKIGNPRSARAVGNALNKNRDSRVPCHRVVRSDGSVGGYVRGIQTKMKLLQNEGVCVRTGNKLWEN